MCSTQESRSCFLNDNIFRTKVGTRRFIFSILSLVQTATTLKLTIDNGDAYVVGSIIGDHWYLYLTGPSARPSSAIVLPTFDHLDLQDETLEILMTNLDPTNAQKFYLDVDDASAKEGHAHGSVVAKNCGLTDIFPVDPRYGGRLDAYAFSPCGFSANAVIATPKKPYSSNSGNPGYYFTVHVTPEEGYSYASFETNVPGDMFPGRATGDVVSRVVKEFVPGRMCITKFLSHRWRHYDSESESEFGRDSGFIDYVKEPWDWKVDGYRRSEKVIYEFDGYDLVFASFVKKD